jgi:hypothetical protein
MSLREALADPARRERVVEDCCTLVDGEVGKKKGLSGVVIKAGYKTVRGIKPGFIRGVISSLLDDWLAAIEPIWQRAVDAGRPPAAELEADPSAVAEALLSVTDAKAEHAKSSIVRGTYGKLRPSAKENVVQAVPGLAALLAKHAA